MRYSFTVRLFRDTFRFFLLGIIIYILVFFFSILFWNGFDKLRRFQLFWFISILIYDEEIFCFIQINIKLVIINKSIYFFYRYYILIVNFTHSITLSILFALLFSQISLNWCFSFLDICKKTSSNETEVRIQVIILNTKYNILYMYICISSIHSSAVSDGNGRLQYSLHRSVK